MRQAADAGRGAAAMLECSTLRTCRMPCSTASCKQMTTLNLLQRSTHYLPVLLCVVLLCRHAMHSVH